MPAADAEAPAAHLSHLLTRLHETDGAAGSLHGLSRAMLGDVAAVLDAYRPGLRLDSVCDAAPIAADCQRDRVRSLARVREAAAAMRERFFRVA